MTVYIRLFFCRKMGRVIAIGVSDILTVPLSCVLRLRAPTCVADGVVAGLQEGVSCLVGVQVDSAYPQQTPSALRPPDIDGVTDAHVGQPAGVADIHASLPSQVKLPRSGQLSPLLRALIHSLGVGELSRRTAVENSAYMEET